MRRAGIAAAVAAIVLAGCGGESKQDQAKNTVCDARADIAKQVDTLKGLTVSTATTSQIKDGVQAIAKDLSTIAGAQGDLNAERKAQVQQANDAFRSQLSDITSTLGSTTSLSDARTKLTAALQDLATAYRQTFAKVDCG